MNENWANHNHSISTPLYYYIFFWIGMKFALIMGGKFVIILVFG
jgi:hypothetical protein